MDDGYNKIVAELENEFPKFKIVEKSDSTLMQVLDVILRISTFCKVRDFLTNYVTLIGYTIYVPSNWKTIDRAEALYHERTHMRQKRKYGRIWFTFSYLFLFPTIFAYYRRKYEQEAYAESMRYLVKHGGIKTVEDKAYRENTIRCFTSAYYFWTWPFRETIEIWYDTTVENLRDEYENYETTPVLRSLKRPTV